MINKKFNNKGSIGIVFMVLFVFVICAVFTVHSDRVAIADDIKSGKLIINDVAQTKLNDGDRLLSATTSHCIKGYVKCTESDLYTAFVAKVLFERARLEMEIER